MTDKPICQLVRDAARELTSENRVPFTRGDIISKLHERNPRINSNSVNPIIQGMTNNLKGGAQGSDGKKILHSVGRGKFVLFSKRDAFQEPTRPTTGSSFSAPETEGELRDFLLHAIRDLFSAQSDLKFVAEGKLSYSLPDGSLLSHASDILVERDDTNKKVSIELKYKSAVTDQFKCRAYDALHLKNHYGEDIYSIMVFAKTRSGISLQQAERISYPYDRFIGFRIEDIDTSIYKLLASEIESFIDGAGNS